MNDTGQTSLGLDADPLATVTVDAPTTDDFDWLRDSSVVLHEQPATAIYINPEGSLVIRQERPWDRDEDTFVFVTKENTQQFLDRLCDVLGIPGVP